MIHAGVTAVGGGVGQAVLRSMQESRLQWRAVGMDTLSLAPGLYWCDEGYLIPPVAEEEKYIEDLLQIAEREHLDLLIPGLDIELEPLARHRDAFRAVNCEVIVASEAAVRLSHDKLALYKFCRQRGLPFVPTYTVEQVQGDPDAHSFPMIAKPRRGKASTGVRLVHTEEEMHRLPRDNDLIVQDYLPPPSRDEPVDPNKTSPDQIDEWSVQFFVDDNGEIRGHFVSINELKEGIPLKIVPRANYEVLEGARSMVENLAEKGLRGPINIQGRETDDGVSFFEANARFTGITAVRASMGYRALDAAVHAFLHGDSEEAQECVPFHTDLVGTRHVEHTTVPKSRVKTRRGTSGRAESKHSPSRRNRLGNVLVTGASGYIGANLIQYLLDTGQAQSVHAGVRTKGRGEDLCAALGATDRLRVVTGSLPAEPWPLDKIDTVVHLAAARPSANGGRASFFEVNAEGTRRLLEHATADGVQRVVFVSSQAVYGTERMPPWPESMTPDPETPYGLSKWIGEQLCMNAGELETIALRVARVFGKGLNMRWDQFPHNYVARVCQDEPLEVYGDGAQRMDLVTVSDVCSAIATACTVGMPSSRHAVFNIGSGNPIAVHDIARLVQERAQERGQPAPEIVHREAQEEWPDFGMDVRRAAARMDWSPTTSFGRAVEELLRAYEERAGD